MLTMKNLTDGRQFRGRDLNLGPTEINTVLSSASINPGLS
jgi:hypothetical protein